jgi:hypothetical protein
MKNNATVQFKGESWCRRQSYSGKKRAEPRRWVVAINKSDAIKIDWWRSEPEDVYFVTVPSPCGRYCDLKKYTGRRVPLPRAIHKLSPERGNKLRFSPYFGRMAHWDRMERTDRDTLIEYFPDTQIVRVHYPTAMRPFQHAFYTKEAIITQILSK